MPSFDELVFRLNGVMNDLGTRRRCRAQGILAEGVPLTEEVFVKLDMIKSGTTLSNVLKAHFELFPTGVAASLMHILRFVCEEKNENIPILFVWLGGYYRLDVQHSHATPDTRGMVTVILHTPPPRSP